MLVLRQLVRELKVRVSHFVDPFDHFFQQFLVGGKLSIQNGAVEVALYLVQVAIGSRQEMLVGNQNQGLLLDVNSFFVALLHNVGARDCFLFRADVQRFEDALLLLYEGVDLAEDFVYVESALFGLHFPFLTVAVSLEADCPRLFSKGLNHAFK